MAGGETPHFRKSEIQSDCFLSPRSWPVAMPYLRRSGDVIFQQVEPYYTRFPSILPDCRVDFTCPTSTAVMTSRYSRSFTY
ncbi:hypothetical protein TNCV_4872111 [Trichonephila clavipes]|nr:hypothetical protein TNCV_4872111 [Trichonephila clavipes]